MVGPFIAGLNSRGMNRGAEGRYNLKAEVGQAWVHGKDSMMRVLELCMVCALVMAIYTLTNFFVSRGICLSEPIDSILECREEC